MALPIDIKELLNEAVGIEEARKQALSVTVLIDGTAPGGLVAHVRTCFASASDTAQVSMVYLSDGVPYLNRNDDFAVIVAGDDPYIGIRALDQRKAGVPVMVVTANSQQVGDAAAAINVPIPSEDLLAPKTAAGVEPIPLDEDALASLDLLMGRWIVSVCAGKKLACALAFPFVRRPLCKDAVDATSLQNAGVGFVLFIPGADLPVMTLNQAKMLLQIAAAFGQTLGPDRIKELAAVVGGAFALRSLARQLVGLAPGLGWAIKAAIGYAGTQAMGRAAIEYFEGGGNASGVANVVVAARDKALDALAASARMPGGAGLLDHLGDFAKTKGVALAKSLIHTDKGEKR